MRMLILGGTWFLGRALAELAVGRGHEVTTFNRGRSGGDVAGVVAVRGDRGRWADLVRLVRGGPWDAVVDTSGMVPGVVRASASVLSRVAEFYVYVSTVNVYRGWPTDPLDDGSEVRAGGGRPLGENAADRYGREKAGCEVAVGTAFPGRSAVLRPSVMIGPREYAGRVPWWLRRVAGGGRVLAPGVPGWGIQPVDVRDVAEFALKVAERRLGGSFNVAAPIGSATFGDLLEACRRVTGGSAALEWVADEFLVRHGVREWVELPLWRPHAGTWRLETARARAAGLRCRPLFETVCDTWEWLCAGDADLDHEAAADVGITPTREAAVLAAWDVCRE
ncbi:NAD-dependent epimerase/dehydratase family protein [Nonomuraea longicatena]|uniref:NAD-dependent epimerase/dehydratase family protein n=2 Tax=Nonomuraea longicatena TaxID=83682 RepID=A0ABP4B1U2_9ACTN